MQPKFAKAGLCLAIAVNAAQAQTPTMEPAGMPVLPARVRMGQSPFNAQYIEAWHAYQLQKAEWQNLAAAAPAGVPAWLPGQGVAPAMVVGGFAEGAVRPVVMQDGPGPVLAMPAPLPAPVRQSAVPAQAPGLPETLAPLPTTPTSQRSAKTATTAKPATKGSGFLPWGKPAKAEPVKTIPANVPALPPASIVADQPVTGEPVLVDENGKPLSKKQIADMQRQVEAANAAARKAPVGEPVFVDEKGNPLTKRQVEEMKRQVEAANAAAEANVAKGAKSVVAAKPAPLPAVAPGKAGSKAVAAAGEPIYLDEKGKPISKKQAEALMKQASAQPAAPAQAPEKKRGFFQRMFGKSRRTSAPADQQVIVVPPSSAKAGNVSVGPAKRPQSR